MSYKKLFIWTKGDKNATHPVADGDTFVQAVMRIQRNGGIFDGYSFFPYHSITQIDIEEYSDNS